MSGLRGACRVPGITLLFRAGAGACAFQAVDYEQSLKAKMRIAGQLFELQGSEVLASEGFARYFQENKVTAPQESTELS